MMGGMKTNPIKIPWFRHPGLSWSLVYLVSGGSRPNLTEGSLSAAMGCVLQGDLIDLGWRFVQGDKHKFTLADRGLHALSGVFRDSPLKGFIAFGEHPGRAITVLRWSR